MTTIPPLYNTINALDGLATGSLESLESLNQDRRDYRYDSYLLAGIQSNNFIELSLEASFDAHLQVINAKSGDVIAEDDDIRGGSVSQLTFLPINGVTYWVRAISHSTQTAGKYTLRSRSIDFADLPDRQPTTVTTLTKESISGTLNNSRHILNKSKTATKTDEVSNIILPSDISHILNCSWTSSSCLGDHSPPLTDATYTYSNQLFSSTSASKSTHSKPLGLGTEIQALESGSFMYFPLYLTSINHHDVEVEYFTLDGSANSSDSKQEIDYYGVSRQKIVIPARQQFTFIPIRVPERTSHPPSENTFELFAKDTAFRDNLSSQDEGKEVDRMYDYPDRGYEGYRINKVFRKASGFDAIGLTSDEKFFVVMVNPKNALIAMNGGNLLEEIETSSGGRDTPAYIHGSVMINQLNNTNQKYTFARGIIYDAAKPPILAIRGGVSKLNDIVSDFDPAGVGYPQYLDAKEAVNDWLRQVSNPEAEISFRPHITGYSQGGALAQWFGASSTLDLGKITTFASPGIEEKPGIDLHAENNQGVTHYITSADPVSMAGYSYLEGTWNMHEYAANPRSNPIKAAFEKHTVPVLNENISIADEEQVRPANLVSSRRNQHSDELSREWFTYLPDADYFAFLYAISKVFPKLADDLVFRGTTERARKRYGGIISKISGIAEAVGGVLHVWDAARVYKAKAWEVIKNQALKNVGEMVPLKPKNDPVVQGSLQASSIDELSEILNVESETIDNFWDVMPSWDEAAWHATMKWSDLAWDSLENWSPQTWQSTTLWSADEWNQPFFVISNSTAKEGSPGISDMVFTVALSNASTRMISTNYSTVDNTATAGSDYIAKAGVLTFLPGQTSQDIIISTKRDNVPEGSESFFLNLYSPKNAKIAHGQVLGTIVDAEIDSTVSVVDLAILTKLVTEDGNANLVYIFTRTGSSTTELTVNYIVGGTATLGKDYTGIATSPSTKTVTFTTGSATVTVTIDPSIDVDIEPDETVDLTLATGANYIIGTTSAITGTISNDDLPSITLALLPDSVTEDRSANLVYTLSRIGPTTSPLTVNYTVAGTALLGTDYTGIATTPTTKSITFAAGSATATVTVDPTAGSSIEPDETVALTIASGTGYTIATTTAVVGTIKNDDPSISLAVAPASGVSEDGTANLIYTFSRTGPTTSPLTVNYTVSGTAALGTDYTGIATSAVNKVVTFATGSATATVTVDPTADAASEANETVTLMLTSGAGYTNGTTTAVTGTILNDDLIGTNANNFLVGTSLDEFIFGASGNDTLQGGDGLDRLDGGLGADVLTGGTGNDTFFFRPKQSLLAAPDRLTDFSIGADKLGLLSASGSPLPAPTTLSRASDNAATSLASLVAAVFSDANGATAGNQPLATKSAALVVATAPSIAGTYLLINDATAGFQSSSDLVVNLTGLTGPLPAPGAIPVSSWFV